ncbi:MAG: hypothetical protein H7328_11435 [Bdellovibrio sp.]|nr:hypothetical protein [Bdellovibrio sp.]
MKNGILFLILMMSLDLFAADESAANRQDKKYLVAAQLLGYGPAASDLKGLHLGYYVDPNTIFQMELTMGSNPLIWGSSGYTILSYVAGAHLKLFTGNSFYLKLGLDYRRIDYRYEDPVLGSSYEKIDFVGSSLGAAFTIGNQWQWSFYTFGVDWIGLSGPFVSQVNSSSTTGTQQNVRRRDKDEDRYLKENVIILSRIYVGACF